VVSEALPTLAEILMQPDREVIFCAKGGCHEPTRFHLKVSTIENDGSDGTKTTPLCPEHIAQFLHDARPAIIE
jgi:hypothetical protein